VLKNYHADQEVEKQKSTRTSLNPQGTGLRIQDSVPFDLQKADAEPCPGCVHSFCMPVTTLQEVQEENRKIHALHHQRLADWNHLAGNKKGGKPRQGKTTSLKIACYCVKLFCKFQSTGGDCPSCTSVQGVTLQRNASGAIECSCLVCNCTCQITFDLSDRRNVALKCEEEERQSAGPTEATDTRSYFNNIIHHHIENRSLSANMEKQSGASTAETVVWDVKYPYSIYCSLNIPYYNTVLHYLMY
jgi:hypothetical protein